MARKSKLEAEKTRIAILDSALEVMGKQGIYKTTLAQIAKHANVTRGAIYWHFEDKGALLTSLWEQVLPHFSENIEKVLITSESQQHEELSGDELINILTELAGHLFTELMINPKMQLLYKISMQAYTEQEFIDHNTQQRLQENRQIENVISQIKEKGQLLPHLTVRSARGIYNSLIEGILQQWLFEPALLDKAFIKHSTLSLRYALFCNQTDNRFALKY